MSAVLTATGATSVTADLADWAAAVAVPVDGREEAAGHVRTRLVDYCANVLAGTSRDSARALADYARSCPGPVPIPGGGSVTPEAAALPLGAAAHALECDDTHQPSSSHPGAVVFSTLLPLAWATDVGWDQVARAAVVGYEVMCRIGEASQPHAEYRRGFHPTGTCGAFGAAAAAAVLLGGEASDLTSAMGIAGSLSSGSMSFLTNGAWTKHLHPGWAAHAGIVAARLALLGYRAPERVIEAPHGYLAGHADHDVASRVTERLGDRALAVGRTSLKAHGCCRYEQAALDGVLALRTQHALGPKDVRRVRVGVLEAGWDIIAAPADDKRRPRNAVEAQFSMPFGAAVALVHGSASVHVHRDETTRDPAVLDLMDRVECFRDPSLERDFPQRWPAIVGIELTDGRQLHTRVEYPKGDPDNPFSETELLEKFHELAREVDQARRHEVVAALDDLAGGGGMTRLRDALVAA